MSIGEGIQIDQATGISEVPQSPEWRPKESKKIKLYFFIFESNT